MTTTINASTSSGLVTTPDNSGDIALQSNGTTKLTISSAGAYGQITSGTVVTASTTSVTITGIPSWAKRITFMLYGVSSSGGSNWLVQLGTSGGIATSGYLGSGSYQGGTNICGGTNYTTGFGILNGGGAQVFHGQLVLSLFNAATNTWVASGVYGDSSQSYIFNTGGSVALSGVATQIRIAHANPADSFDAGSFNILYEG